jgi:hypothetical protein
LATASRKNIASAAAKLIEREQPDVWRPSWESGYMATLARLAKHVSEFDTNKVHLNLMGGMFNTETFELEEHNSDFHSSIQNPIEYDPEARKKDMADLFNDLDDEAESEGTEDAVVEEQHEDDAVAFGIDFLVNGLHKGLTFDEWLNKEADSSDQQSFRFQRLAFEDNPLFQERVTVA